MLNDAGRMGAHSVRIFVFVQAVLRTLLAHNSFGAGEIPDRWYSPRTPKGSRTGETL